MVGQQWSLAQRVGAGIGLALLLFGFVLGIAAYQGLSNLLEQHLSERANSHAHQLALFSADAILIHDYATLERYTSALASEPGVLEVTIRRDDGEVLAHAIRPGLLQGNSATSPMVNSGHAVKRLYVQHNLNIGGSIIGVVKLGVDRGPMEAYLQRLAWIGLGFLLAMIVLIFLGLRWFIERGLIRPIEQLALAANPLSGAQCSEPKSLPEELARLARVFRQLCADVQTHLSGREQAEQLARNATDRLTRQQRLATAGQIAAGVAHNLNTPLGSIRGYAQLLLEQLSEPEQRRKAQLIVEQSESCATSVRNLLTTVHPPKVKQQVFDLHGQLEVSLEVMRPLFRDWGMQVKALGFDSRCDVIGDPAALEQILFNLFSNAAQAGASELSVRLLKNDSSAHCALRIDDNGPGIDARLRDSLFDPFVTEKEPGEGTGLGLYLSRQLAEGMQAGLTLGASEPTKGACFVLSLRCNTNPEGTCHTV